MSLTVHSLSTDQAEYYGVEKTISIREGSTAGANMTVTVEHRDDLPILFQVIDAFVGKHTNLLPDYGSKQFIFGRQMQVVIFIGTNYVTIFFRDMEEKAKAITITYEVPSDAQKLPLPAVKRHSSQSENLN